MKIKNEKIETKFFNGKITSHKVIDRNGVEVGIIEGYIATWDLDRGDDEFIKGCFFSSIERHKQSGRQIRLKDMHYNVIGGWPIETVREDEKGLFAIGEINLEIEEGRKIFSLIKQGVLTDLSIGYSAKEVEYVGGIRKIAVAEIWEGSVVDEPMNPKANITSVKSINDRKNLPVNYAGLDVRYDNEKAISNIDKFGIDINQFPDKCFLFTDKDGDGLFNVSDIVNDELKIIPRAVFVARAILSGCDGKELNYEIDDINKIKSLINMLYIEMEMNSPFDEKGIRPFCTTEIKNVPKSILENIIRHCEISKKAGNYIASNLLPAIEAGNSKDSEVSEGVKDLLETMRSIKSNFKE